MKYKLDDGFLAYDQVGEGTPVLFIHGYPLSRKIWHYQMVKLSQDAHLISVDLRGHGESYPFEGPYSMDTLADDCKSLMDSKRIKVPIVVCGLSMGGYVTLALYRKYPQIFKAMILTSTRAGADSDVGKANREAAIKNVHEHGIAYIADSMLPKIVSKATLIVKPTLVKTIREIMLETSVQGIVGSSLGMRDRPDSTSLLAQIHFPVLIIHGADDQLIPVSEAEAMQQKITDSRLVVIPDAGHLPNMEQPDLFNHAIREFINTLPQT
jgi:3-oxoadipate enol-lactonase